MTYFSFNLDEGWPSVVIGADAMVAVWSLSL